MQQLVWHVLAASITACPIQRVLPELPVLEYHSLVASVSPFRTILKSSLGKLAGDKYQLVRGSPYDYLAISKDVCREVTMDPGSPPYMWVFGEQVLGKLSD